jgi:hypothetical protein
MKKYILNTLLSGLICLFLVSCVKEKVGPDLKAISEPVSFTTPFAVNTSTPDFSSGDKIYFSATFANEAYWVITITGATSGAVKTFEGTGTLIKNATWDGSANSIPSFGAEAATAVLSFPRSTSAAVSLNITIAGKKNHDIGNVLITDFSTTKFSGPGADPDLFWPSDWVSTTAKNNVPYVNPDGNPYCMMGPNGAWQPNADFPGHNSPYVDFLTISANSLGYPTYFPLIADPTKIYFNMMMYNDASTKNTWLQVILHEEHPTDGTTMAKSVSIKPTWVTGWKLVTLRYQDFKLSDTTKVINNPQKIKDVQLVLLSSASQAILDAGTNPVSATFDHLIFTHYKPYQP